MAACGHGIVVYPDDIERCDSRPVGTLQPASYGWEYPTEDLCANSLAKYMGVCHYDCEECEQDDDLKLDAVCYHHD